MDTAVAVIAEQRLQETFGTTVLQFSHLNTANVSVTVRIKTFAVEPVEENGTLNLKRVLTLKVIAGQANFPIPTDESEPVEPGDGFLYLNRLFEVMVNGITADPTQQVYTLRCIQSKRDSQGTM